VVVTIGCGIKGWISFCVVMIYVYACIYAYFIVSSPYLLVFGDDHIRSTSEQMMLQVDLVRYRAGAGIVLGEEFYHILLRF